MGVLHLGAGNTFKFYNSSKIRRDPVPFLEEHVVEYYITLNKQQLRRLTRVKVTIKI